MELITIKRLTGPWLVPYTPDCDYANGEELLTPEKIKQIHATYKNYNIIDYEHQFTFKNSPYFLKNYADNVTTWITDNETTFTDITGAEVTTPAGTLWGSVEVNDPEIERRVDEGLLSAFSVTVAERADADKVMTAYKNRYSFKTDTLTALENINELLSTKKVLIKDIKDPVLLTTTLTGLPCVNKAKFCINSLNTANKSKEEDNMTEEQTNTDSTTEQVETNTDTEPVDTSSTEPVTEPAPSDDEVLDEDGFFNNVLKSINGFRKYNEQKGDKDMKQKEVNELLENKLEASNKSLKDELISAITENNKQLTESFKSEMDKLREETRKELENENKKETDANTDKDTVKGRGGKAHKSEKQPAPINESNQLESNADGIGAGKSYHQSEINERDYLYKFIKGGISTKSDMPKITYKGLSILPEALPTAPSFSLIHPALKDSFSASFTEQGTEKLIFNTQQFGLYMRDLLSIDPLMQDANFRIDYQVSDEERKMYALRYDEDPTQDGAMEEHYYFDNPELTAAEIEVSDQLLKPETVRALLHISDKQLRNNVFGESLLDNALGMVKTRYDEGISRINYFSDTTLANTTDIKFRRRDGILKQAGVKLESDEAASGGAGDFDYGDGVEKLVRDMFRALPYEAQKDALYNLYVPPFVYDDYRQYYLKAGEGINFLGNITDEIVLKYNKITVKEAPILADPAGIALYGDKVPLLLTSPQNTHFCVGRAMGIEPERLASTGSTKYWFTGDFDCKFALPEYAVVANLAKNEYEAL